jgi:Domain of unknown function (DUF397)
MGFSEKHTENEIWRKSSYSEGAGDCVEVKVVGPIVVRDSRCPDGPVLRCTAHVWNTFLTQAKDGRFDLA